MFKTIQVTAENHIKSIKAVEATKNGFVKAVISTKENPESVITQSFDYLLDYCKGYYNFTVKIQYEPDFKKALDEAIEEQIEKEIDRLKEEFPEEYSLGHDRDYVNVGVGNVCVRDDEIWDDDRLRDDARDNIEDDFFNNLIECGSGTKSEAFCDLVQQYIGSK